MRKEDDSFFPNNTTFFVTHVVNLIEDNPSDLAHDLGTMIEHGSKNRRI